MNELAQQVAVVTGAGRGIGQAIALQLAAAGADIAGVDLQPESCAETVAKVQALGRRAWAFGANVADAASVTAAAEQILAAAGKVDILVNNAGITRDGLLMRMSEADWDAVLDVNLKGTFLFTKAFTRSFLKQQSGRIINRLRHRPDRQRRAVQLRREQSRRHRLHQVRRPGAGVPRHHRQRHRPRLHRDRHDGEDQPRGARGAAEANPAGQPGPARGRGRRRPVPGRARRPLPHRAGAFGGRRHGHVIYFRFGLDAL